MKEEIEFSHRHVFLALLGKRQFISGKENLNAKYMEVECFILYLD